MRGDAGKSGAAPGAVRPLLIRALRGERVERVPIWLMRQAGRYLPEYRTLRAKHDFITMCRSAELAARVALQPMRRYGFDAAIVFSDILLILDAMGAEIAYEEGGGPIVGRPVRDADDVRRLREADPERDLPQVAETIRMLVRELGATVPVIGFAGGPFTLMTYLMGGKVEQGPTIARALLLSDPGAARELLGKLARAVAALLAMQIAAGATAVHLFDTWAGTLGREAFRTFAAPSAARVFEDLARLPPEAVPMIYFARNAAHLLPHLGETGAGAFGLDWLCDLREARATLGPRVALQGNLDPAALLAAPESLRREAAAVLEAGGGVGHVFNLGHGVLPSTDPEMVRMLVDAVRGGSTGGEAVRTT